MKNKINILVILLLNFSNPLFSQVSIEESSNLSDSEITKESNRTLENWNYYLRNDLDSLRIDGQRIITIGLRAQNDFAINVGKRSLGSYFIRTGNTDKGIIYLKDSKFYFEKKNNFILLTEILNEIGNGYLYAGKPIEAEKYYLKSLRAGKESPDETSAFLAEVNLAQAYINLNNFEKASAILQHYKNESLKRQKLEAVSNAYALLGTIEDIKGNKILAIEYFKKSANFGFKSKAKSQIGHAYNNLAIANFGDGNEKLALDYFLKALAIRLKTGNVKSIAESYFNLGEFYVEIKDFSKANFYYSKSEEYSKQHNLIKEQMDALLAKIAVDKLERKYEAALQKMESYVVMQKDYFSELSASKTSDMELIESIDQIEFDISAKNQDEKLESVIHSQKLHTYFLYGAFGILALALIALLSFKKKIN